MLKVSFYHHMNTCTGAFAPLITYASSMTLFFKSCRISSIRFGFMKFFLKSTCRISTQIL